jgi:general secretion pathway protein F
LRSQLLAAILEPALILVMGGLVLAIVLAVMMPLIEMNSLIR